MPISFCANKKKINLIFQKYTSICTYLHILFYYFIHTNIILYCIFCPFYNKKKSFWQQKMKEKNLHILFPHSHNIFNFLTSFFSFHFFITFNLSLSLFSLHASLKKKLILRKKKLFLLYPRQNQKLSFPGSLLCPTSSEQFFVLCASVKKKIFDRKL